MSTPGAPAEFIRVYGGMAAGMWARTHHTPAHWEEGRAIALLLADGGTHQIGALYPAGVALRQETDPARSRESPVVSREEVFPCTRLTVGAPRERPPLPKRPNPVAATPVPSAAPAGGLFTGSDW